MKHVIKKLRHLKSYYIQINYLILHTVSYLDAYFDKYPLFLIKYIIHNTQLPVIRALLQRASYV